MKTIQRKPVDVVKIDELRRALGIDGWIASEEEQQAVVARLRERGLELSDLYQEMEMSQRYVNTQRDVTYDWGSVSLHSHSFYEIIYCESAAGVEYLVGTRRYRLRRGDVIVVQPGVSHQPILPDSMAEPYRRSVLWLSTEFIEHFYLAIQHEGVPDWEGSILLRTADTPWEGVGEYFRAGVEEAERRAPDWESYVVGNTMILLTLLRRAREQSGAPLIQPEQPELLDQVLRYIEAHLAEPVSLSAVARAFWVSESTVSQTFHRRMGSSFHRCLTQRRLIEAKTLILRGIPLKEINERVGFSDYSVFYRAFKREFGVSPREFRQLSGRDA